jgi:sugar/nucleoside kinase (ribokinase family)
MTRADSRQIDPEIVAIGVACMDHAVAVESLTGGERVNSQRYVQTGGGMAATGMVAAARLGARCSLASSAGDDPAGHFLRDELAGEGIDLTYFRLRPSGRTGVSLCLSETCSGRKLIIGLAGGTQRMTPVDVDEGFYRMVRRAKLLHLDGFHADLALAAAQQARAAGVPVHLDATIGGPTSNRFLAVSDIVFASQSFCERRFDADVSPKALTWLADITPARWVGLTMGAAGSMALDRKTNRRYFQPAFEIEVLDTVGAGDSFHGAMSFALARGWPMDKAMRLATAVGAMCCLGLGGREGLPTLRQAQAFLRKAKPLAPKRGKRK